MPGAEWLGTALGPALLTGALVVALAGLVRGLAGFGGALVMVPILSLLYGPAPAVATVITIELAGYLQLLPGALPHIRWREVAPMGLAALVALPLGVYLVVHLPPGLMRRAIGAIVAVLAVLLMVGWRLSRRPGRPVALAVAALSGLLGGLAGTPGPPVVLLLYVGPDSAAENRQQLIGYFSVLDLAAMGLYATQGALGRGALARALLLIPVSIVATWLGARLHRRTGEQWLRRLALGLILGIGLVGLLY